ncbi:MAG: DNA polymerase IV [Legionellaceae bacterium]|nr:DNA polymerase IV [Legionellaceae bacterium]
MIRKIIHIDMDCFYAAIEMRDYPELVDKPIAVGGSPDRRGVIATCNYHARRFGVRSAMATGYALKLCPDLVIQPGRMDVYREESQLIRDIFSEYSNKVEPLSLDEAYLDVTGSTHHAGSASWIAEAIRARIYEARQLTASAGIAPNKSLAKIASDWNKPNGQKLITPEEITNFMHHLPVRKLLGVGPVMESRLNTIGIQTCAELQKLSKIRLAEQFGSMGERLYDLSRGVDDREVESVRIRKSISVEETYVTDLKNLEQCLNEIPALLERLDIRMKRAGDNLNVHNLFVKLKFDNFEQTTVERLAHRIDIDWIECLIQEGWERKLRPVRLLGIGVRLEEEKDNHQPYIQLPLPHID